MMTLLLASCASKTVTKIKTVERPLSFVEKEMKAKQAHIDANIDRSTMSPEQKLFYKLLTRCQAELIPNPFTVDNLTSWQQRVIRDMATQICQTRAMEALQAGREKDFLGERPSPDKEE